MKKIKRILLIQIKQLGDVLMTTPAIRQLRQIYKDAKIDFLTGKLGSFVLKYNSNIDNLIVINNNQSLKEKFNLFYRIRKSKYDLVIDFYSNPFSAQITLFSGAKHRIGFDYFWRNYSYTKVYKVKSDEYSAVSKLRLIESLGANLDDNKIEFPISNDYDDYADEFCKKHKINENTVAICPISRRSYKIWDPKNFATISKFLIDKGHNIFFFYGPGEKEDAMKVVMELEKMGVSKENYIIDYEMPDILESRAILQKTKMFVGNDGGPKHIAVCSGIKTVTIFGSVYWKNWTDMDYSNHKAVYIDYDCRKTCLHNKCTDMKCFYNITSDDVINKIKEII